MTTMFPGYGVEAPDDPTTTARDRLVFVDPSGLETDLSDLVNFSTLWGVHGRGMPRFDFVEEELPGIDGADLRDVLVPPREITVPIFIEGDDAPDLTDVLRVFASRLNPLRGDGLLRTNRAELGERELVCRYAGGLELTESREESGKKWQRALLVFRASGDPFWRDVDDVVVPIPSGAAGGSFFPFFPLRLTSSSVYAEAEIDNEGDGIAWPVWTIVGPATGIMLENVLTGDVFESSIELASEEHVTIDTRPGRRGITDHTGANRYSTVTGHDLWGFVPGSQNVRVQIAGTDDDTEVSVAYRPRHLTA